VKGAFSEGELPLYGILRGSYVEVLLGLPPQSELRAFITKLVDMCQDGYPSRR